MSGRPPRRHIPWLLALALMACDEAATPTASPPPTAPRTGEAPTTVEIERVAQPTSVCGSDVEDRLRRLIGLVPLRCGDQAVLATYMRVGIGSHDVLLVQSIDMTSTYTDGAPDARQWVVVDDQVEERSCESPECSAPSTLLDGLAASSSEPDDDLEVLLAIAITRPLQALLRAPADVEPMATSRWPEHAALLRSVDVGLRRSGDAVTLTALSCSESEGWRGNSRILRTHSATLDHGTVRTSEQTLLDSFTPRVPFATERARPWPGSASEDPLADLWEP